MKAAAHSESILARKEAAQRAAAFTLLELLLVIAIIAILASLLFTALSRSRASALSLRCKSNLHQTGLSLMLFVNDHEFYPFCSLWPDQRDRLKAYMTDQLPYGDWQSALSRYLTADKDFYHKG